MGRGTVIQKLKAKTRGYQPSKEKKCGKILVPQKDQEKGLERR